MLSLKKKISPAKATLKHKQKGIYATTEKSKCHGKEEGIRKVAESRNTKEKVAYWSD